MLKLSFDVINSEVFDRLDQECFLSNEQKENKTWFDEKKGVLYLKEKKIIIDKQDKISNAHKVLKYIFIDNKNNLNDDFFYSELAFDEFEDLEYKEKNNAWRKYYNACQDVNFKIEKQTNDNIKNFLKFNTGKKGKFKINQKYL